MPVFCDMHCHLDFATDATQAALRMQEAGAAAFSPTVEPGDYASAQQLFADTPCVRVGVGLHPWWIDPATYQVNLQQVLAQLEQTRYIGEVGLDFAPSYRETRELQIEVFDAIVAACAHQGDKVLTIHAVQSAQVVLDMLEAHKACESCTCILHWFSDSSQQLHRALSLGCFVSLGERSLATKRGRAYAQAILVERLLFETDMPERGSAYQFDAMQEQLSTTCAQIAALRAIDADVLATRVATTSSTLLQYP